MNITKLAALFSFLTASLINAAPYHGNCSVDGDVVEYWIPETIVGRNVYVADHLSIDDHRVYYASFVKSSIFEKKTVGSVSISLIQVAADQTESPEQIKKYFEQHAHKQGVRAKFESLPKGELPWIKQELFDSDGSLNNISYICPINPKRLLVVRIGSTFIGGKVADKNWPIWKTGLENVIRDLKVKKNIGPH